jgi:hypothetical protein
MVLLGQGVAWLALATGASALVSTAPCAPRRPLRLALRPAASTLAPAASTDELGQHWESPLEPTLVSDHLTFAKKMEVIDAYFEARPAQVARRLGTVAAAAARRGGVGLGRAVWARRGSTRRRSPARGVQARGGVRQSRANFGHARGPGGR